MQRWTGAGTRGKSGAGARRSLVLRFLNSCHNDEMKVFIDLITHGFKEIYGKLIDIHGLVKCIYFLFGRKLTK